VARLAAADLEALATSGAPAEPTSEDAVFIAASGVRRLRLGDRRLLFSESRQQLYELNPTADLIWRGLDRGKAAEVVARSLEAAGASPDEAIAHVRTALREWLLGGELVPTSVPARLASRSDAVRSIRIDDLSVELAFHGELPVAGCDDVFGHLYARAELSPRRLAVVRDGELAFLFRGKTALGACAPNDLTAHLKACLTEAYVAAVGEGFVAHGALLTRGDAAVMLSGAPGAGKTTLAVALAAAGWAYGGDDIVRFDGRGKARGVPFAGAVKQGAWGLAARYAPEVLDLPVATRSDGQSVRYWRPDAVASREPRALSAFVLLARTPGEAARLEAIEALGALTAILESAYSEKRRLDAGPLAALAGALESARCARLVYDDLGEAVAALEALADV